MQTTDTRTPDLQPTDTATTTQLWTELRQSVAGLTGTIASLALAEARLAVLSSVSMVALALLAAAFGFAGWVLFAVALAAGLQQIGLPLWAAYASLALLHALVAFACWRRVLRLSGHLEFPATRSVIVQSWQTATAEGPTLASPVTTGMNTTGVNG